MIWALPASAAATRKPHELNPAEQVLTVGKQLTYKLYIGYEYSISSAEQSVKLIYRIDTRHTGGCPYR